MKPESYAWRQLEEHAAARLRTGFANRVLRATSLPDSRFWIEFEERAVASLRPNFADRVLYAVRTAIPAEMPSLFSQFALCAATAALCLIAVVYVHDRTTRLAEDRSLADWKQLAADAQDLDLSP